MSEIKEVLDPATVWKYTKQDALDALARGEKINYVSMRIDPSLSTSQDLYDVVMEAMSMGLDVMLFKPTQDAPNPAQAEV